MSERSWAQFYTLDGNLLGRGGQAEVLRATDRESGAVVALKRLAPVTGESLARMKREIQVQQQLTHPRVMPVIRHSERYSWYSMPLAHRTLRDLSPPLEPAEILEIVSAGLEALIAAHQLRFVHRDITPTNILDIGCDAAPHWVVSDWGLVRRHELATVTRTKSGEFGTAGFAAPETWVDAHTADERADIYSLGRVAAWAATGETLVPNVPVIPQGPFEAFVRAATSLRRDDRPIDAVAALALLSEIVVTRPKTSPGPPGIPSEVVAAIRAQAATQFPDDYSTQKYVIQRELDAWHKLESLAIDDLPAHVLASITSSAAHQFPDDFSTRLYVIEREAEAWRDLQTLDLPVPTAVLERIVAKARREFPNDYSTQRYVIQREAEAWRELNG